MAPGILTLHNLPKAGNLGEYISLGARETVAKKTRASCSVTKLCATPWTAACQVSLSTVSWSWLKFTFIQSRMPFNHLILCCSLLLLPSIFPSIRVFSNSWPEPDHS